MLEISIKTPQLIGIILGCIVFTITILVVAYLLYASGSLAFMVNAEAPSAMRNSCKFPINDYPKLYDELLEARKTIDLKNFFPTVSGCKIKLCSLNVKFIEDLMSCSNGDAIFGASRYDPSIIWGWIENSYEIPEDSTTPPVFPAMSTALFKSFYNMKEDAFENCCHIVIIDIELNKPIGMISILDNNISNLTARLGNVWLTPHFHHQKRSLEAFHIILKYLFEKGYRRITVEADSRNLIFKRFLEKVGFKLEAVLRKYKIIYDRNCDICLYVILNSEWLDIDRRIQKLIILKSNLKKIN